MQIKVQPTDKIDRIDKFLAEKLSVSRSFAQKQIKEGQVTINKKTINAHCKPCAGDIIEITKTEKKYPKLSENKNVDFKVIDEKNNYIIIEKPSGLIVHPAQGISEPTLADGLIARFPELSGVGEDPLRPGIVHRLDKDVSGLMAIARTQEMFIFLKNQFQTRTIKKEYLALVHGLIEDDEGEINTPIGRSKTKSGKMAAHTQTAEKDKKAKTEFRVLKKLKKYTFINVKILTGRSHQIRVHMNSIGHPVAGDELYTNRKIKRAGIGRIFLHASKLEFDDLNGMRKKYESELPEKLKTFYETLN